MAMIGSAVARGAVASVARVGPAWRAAASAGGAAITGVSASVTRAVGIHLRSAPAGARKPAARRGMKRADVNRLAMHSSVEARFPDEGQCQPRRRDEWYRLPQLTESV